MSATPVKNTAPADEFAGALSTMPPFQDLSAAVIGSLYENADKRQYSAGQTVYSLGQYDGGEFFVVMSGRLRVTLIDGETGAMMIEEFAEKSIFGLEFALVQDGTDLCQKLAVTAEDDVDLIAIEADAFRMLANGRPSLMRNIANYFANSLSALRFKSPAMEQPSEKQVFAALLEFVERDEVSGQWRIPKMPKHRELAHRAGVDEAVAAEAVATLIQDNVALRDYPGLIVTNMNELEKLANI